MAITYRWEIIRLQVKPSADGQQNVLYRIHWRLWGKLVDETGVYESSIVRKIQERFSGSEQQMFLMSFYGYLKYHPTKDFVIDLDKIWRRIRYLFTLLVVNLIFLY